MNHLFFAIASTMAMTIVLAWVVRSFLLRRFLRVAPQIFISYRRSDSEEISNSLFRDLSRRFGIASVFLDSARISGGEKFPRQIEYRLEDADIVLVVIGANWEKVASECESKPRIFNEDDWVRREILRALELNKVVVPLRINSRDMPKEAAIPIELKGLLANNGEGLSTSTDYETHLKKIIGICEKSTPVPTAVKTAVVSDFLCTGLLLLLPFLIWLAAHKEIHNLNKITSSLKKEDESLPSRISESKNQAIETAREYADSTILPFQNELPMRLSELAKLCKANRVNTEDYANAVISLRLTYQGKDDGLHCFQEQGQPESTAAEVLLNREEALRWPDELRAGDTVLATLRLTDESTPPHFYGTKARLFVSKTPP